MNPKKKGQKEILFKVKGISHFIMKQESWSRKYTGKKNKNVKKYYWVKGISHFIMNQESWSRKYAGKKNKNVNEW